MNETVMLILFVVAALCLVICAISLFKWYQYASAESPQANTAFVITIASGGIGVAATGSGGFTAVGNHFLAMVFPTLVAAWLLYLLIKYRQLLKYFVPETARSLEVASFERQNKPEAKT